MNPTDNSQDIITVANIDIGCNDVSEDIVRVSNRKLDPETQQVFTEQYEKTEQWGHDKFFRVKWDGKPIEIAPGRAKPLPRYLAEHYAKHLADHILQNEELKTGKKGLVQSAIRRPEVLKQILTEVTSTFGDVSIPEPDYTEPVSEPIETQDIGPVPNYAVGKLEEEPKTLSEILKEAGENPDKVDRIPLEETSIYDDKKPIPTRKQLLELCYQQEIKVTGQENKEQLIALLKKA